MNVLIAPILVPLLTALLCLFVRDAVARRLASVAGAALGLLAGVLVLVAVQRQGIVVLRLGDWPAPFGITLVADLLSAIMVVLTGLSGLTVALYSLGDIDRRRESVGFHPLFHILLMGVALAFLTGDLFNLYVSFEVMLMASFVLLALGGERGQLEGSVKYLTLNMVSSLLFLAGCGIAYGITGTLNMADLADRMPHVVNTGVVLALSLLLLVAFGIKAAVFPMFFWLPASYHTPPVAVSAVFAGLLTKVGVYALLRTFTLLFTQNTTITHTVILVLAGCTMLTGVLGAAAQREVRRILSFHSISQIGYMIMGLALFTPLALAGTVLFLIHHNVVKANLFLIGGVIERMRGSERLSLIGGLYRPAPLLAVLFLLSALSLAGIPPLSGFWAKYALVLAGLQTQQWLIVAAALVTGLLTLYSMTKIWAEAFWKDQPAPGDGAATLTARPVTFTMLTPIALLAALTVVIGVLAEPLFALSLQAASQLLDPRAYVRAVLGR